MTSSIFKVRISSFFVFLFFSYTAFSQVNSIPGYLIKLNGDTTRGYIDYRNWKKNPSEISFKSSMDKEWIRFNPLTIAGFSVADEIYRSSIIEKESILNESGDSRYDSKLITETDTVFLQMLISGSKSLLFLEDDNGTGQLYVPGGSGYTLLTYKRYLKIQDGKQGYIENRTFIGQLYEYLKDCQDISQTLNHLEYTRADLIKLFIHYFECAGSPIQFRKHTEKIIIELGIEAGVVHSKMDVKSTTNALKDINFKSSEMPSGGLFFDFVIPRSQRKWSSHNEIIYMGYKTHGAYTDDFNAYAIDFAFDYLKLNLMLRYTYPIQRSFVFAGVGMSNAILIHKVNEAHESSIFHPPSVNPAFEDIRKYEQGIVFEAGTRIKSFSLALHFEATNGFSPFTATSTPVKNLYLFLGYRFK
ncbi:MAG: hypothetical protein IPP15_00425 [Saprospiraceae bacterium]|uniref:Outer membrane protein beta-barrel domain-containing protein n=1 Tax=Candidatus Opimibacter skivensis TaxID=2982028 RepID=A0A9D7STU1_9BACT|nr:hypothetical protein [Candidatus Opimibacter skivensis]